jgi:predicted Zn-dependent protease
VAVIGQSGQAQFSTGPYNGSLDTYIGQVFRSVAGNQTNINYSRPQRTTINGIPAAISTARAQTQQGVVDVTVVAYEFARDRAYHFVTVTRGGTGLGPLQSMVGSVRRLSAQEAAAIRPRVIQIVTVGANDTVQSLGSRMAYSTYQVERFRALNGLASNAALQRGQRVKVVVYGRRT